MNKIDQYKGCMIGGAIGDALGWLVEFLSHSEIKSKFGNQGITDLIVAESCGLAEITDDTQMTLFTGEGLLRAETRGLSKGICHAPSVVYNAYLRWLKTQGYPEIFDKDWIYDGWLINHKELFNRRAPGNTCIEALNSNDMGTIDQPLNNSKGCGGVMRIAPVGLIQKPENAFRLGMECAALTHGHPTGYLTAGTMAYIIAALIEGRELTEAINMSINYLDHFPNHEECSISLRKAIALSQSNVPSIEAISSIGKGWIAEEALAIAIYCSLKYADNFKESLIASVNHDGDSDSTGAITGNIIGAKLGISRIPSEWINKVELSEVILEIAEDLFDGSNDTDTWWEKYPGY